MGRAYQVRASSMAATASKRSALFMRASKEIYMAAKNGVPDPTINTHLRGIIDKYRALNVTKEVIDRAIKKAQGGEGEAYIAGRYEAFGPGNCYLVVDTLTDNINRAITDVRNAIHKKDGKMGSVVFNFTEYAQFIFRYADQVKVEEHLILEDINVLQVNKDEDFVEVLVPPDELGKTKIALDLLGIQSFEVAEITLIPNDLVTLNSEDFKTFQLLLDALDELQDVQNVYHNVEGI
jgi:YebC/PmpR family DNA-binding regulatory protein